MSLRLVAKELYKLKKELEVLQKEFDDNPGDFELEQKFRRLKNEHDRIQSMLEGHKEESLYRKPR